MDRVLLNLLLDDDYGIPSAAYWRIIELCSDFKDESLSYGPRESITKDYLEGLHSRVRIQDDRAYLTNQ